MVGVHGDHTCPCCGYMTLGEREAWEICPICFWEDEPITNPYRPTGGPNGSLSLYEAQQKFMTCGASDEVSLPAVRRPSESDRRDPAWRPLPPPPETTERAVRELHFDPKWFEYQLLPTFFFELQMAQYHNSEDSGWRCTEHHRYLAFQTILASRTELSDLQLEQYIELCLLDEDEAMACSALVDLLQWPGLSRDQYERVTEHPAFANPVAQKLIWRNRMDAELQAETIPDQVFLEILARRDSQMERRLVSCDAISRNQLEILAYQGASRAVRHMAKDRLGRRK